MGLIIRMKRLISSILLDGLWGITHGLSVLAIMGFGAWITNPFTAILSGFLATAYWVNREAVARGTWDIRTWYLDSQLDAIVPTLVFIVCVIFILCCPL